MQYSRKKTAWEIAGEFLITLARSAFIFIVITAAVLAFVPEDNVSSALMWAVLLGVLGGAAWVGLAPRYTFRSLLREIRSYKELVGTGVVVYIVGVPLSIWWFGDASAIYVVLAWFVIAPVLTALAFAFAWTCAINWED